MKYIDDTRVSIHYEMPLNEIIYDFFDYIKSKTKGYASVDYTFKENVASELVKLDIYINNEPMDALSFIVHKDTAYTRGRKMAERLKKEIPRQLFEVPIQAVVSGKIIARETVRAVRKDVLAKCYGGDITRKKKLLEKQKKGKKKMKQIGNVEVPIQAVVSGKIIARETVRAVRKDVLAKCYGGDITRKKKLLEKQKKGKKKMKQIGNVEVPQEAFLSVLKFDTDEE